MSRKLFGKRSIAVLSAVVILFSLIAAIPGLVPEASAAYTPARTISITGNSSNTGAKMGIINSQKVLGASVTYTVRGYYKTEGFTPVGDVCYGFICHGTAYSTPKYAIYANNDWTPFEFTGVTSGLEANTDQWIMAGFVNAYGTLSFADVVITNSSGTVLYDMATDTALKAGTTTNVVNSQPGMWYFTAPTVTIGATNSAGSSSGGASTGALTLTASATTVAKDTNITLTATGGATSIVVSRTDGQWTNTYQGSSVTVAFGWEGSYTAYATDGTNQSASVDFVVGAATQTAPPSFATVTVPKLAFTVGESVTFTISSDGDLNNLWIYAPNPNTGRPGNDGVVYENVGNSYTLTFTQPGQYSALVQAWNGIGNFLGQKIGFTITNPTSKPTTAAPTTAKPTTAAPTTAKPTTAAPTTAKPTTAAPTTAKPTTAAPTTAKPTTVKPTTAAPTTVKPTTAAPTTAKPTTAAPTTAKPTTAAPTTAAPTTAKPTTAKPTTTKKPVAKPNSAAVITNKAVYTVNETVTFICSGNGTSHTLWIYYPNGTQKSYTNVGDTYTLSFNVPGMYGALLQTKNSAGTFESQAVTFTVNLESTETTQPTTPPETQPTTPPVTEPEELPSWLTRPSSAPQATQPSGNGSGSGNQGGYWLWLWLAIILFVVFIVIAVILLVKRNKKEDQAAG